MNFRLSVEAVVYFNSRVLLVKRGPECKVAPGVWNVPAGKVRLLETTKNAVIRETREETGLNISVIELLAEEEAFEIMSGEEKAFRNMFTFLTVPQSAEPEVVLNEEHTEFYWVSKEELESPLFSSLMPRLKTIIIKAMSKGES